MTEVYEFSAGRGPDVRPGVDRDTGPAYEAGADGFVPRQYTDDVMREGKNIGLNKAIECESFYAVCHGTPSAICSIKYLGLMRLPRCMMDG